MDEAKRARLEADGWVVSTVEEFLGLDADDVKAIDERMEREREAKRAAQEDEDRDHPTG